VIEAHVGENVVIHSPVNIYGWPTIGDNTSIGAFTEIGSRVEIGQNVRIQAHCFIPHGVEIRDYCFIGPRVTFCNVKNPDPYRVVSEDDYGHTIVFNGTTIGAGAVILPGLHIGPNAFIGAGSVVTKDVGSGVMCYGNPAKFIRKREV